MANATFVGRAAELDRIEEAVSTAAAGHEQVVMVTGEPGIGKTRFATEAADRLGSRLGCVLYGRCDDGGPPYQPVAEALTGYLRESDHTAPERWTPAQRASVANLVPSFEAGAAVHTEPDAETAKAKFLHGVAGAVARLPANSLVILDDIQWANDSTLQLLKAVLAWPVVRRTFLLLFRSTERPPGLTSWLADIRLAHEVVDIALPGLSEPEAVALAAAYGSSANGDVVARSGGNPFFLSQLVEHPDDVPEGVQMMIERRLEGVGEHTRDLLALAAVVGRQWDVAVLSEAGQRSEDEVIDQLAEAYRSGLAVEIDAQSGAFTHDLIRQALLGSMTATRVAALNGRVGLAMLSSSRYEPAQEVRHLLAAQRSETIALALPVACEATDRLVGLHAHDEAIRLSSEVLAAAAQHGLPSDPATAELAFRLAGAHALAGHRHASCKAFVEAARLCSSAGLHHLVAESVVGHMMMDPNSVSAEYADFVRAALASRSLDTRTECMLLGASSLLHGLGDGLATSAKALELARTTGDPELVAGMLAVRCASTGLSPDIDARIALATEQLEINAGNRSMSAWALFGSRMSARRNLVRYYLQRGDRARFEEQLESLVTTAADVAQPAIRDLVDAYGRLRLMMDGRFAECEELVTETLSSKGFDLFIMGQLLLLRYEQGRMGEIAAMLEPFAASRTVALVQAALALTKAELGQIDAARTIIRGIVSGEKPLTEDATTLAAWAFVANASSIVGDEAAAAAIEPHLSPHSGAVIVVSGVAALGPVDRFMGRLQTVLGQHDRAEQHLRAALELDRRMDAGPSMTRTRVALAELLLARGQGQDLAEAAELATAARHEAAALGMQRVLGAAEELIHKL